jgi:hypothetical protein
MEAPEARARASLPIDLGRGSNNTQQWAVHGMTCAYYYYCYSLPDQQQCSTWSWIAAPVWIRAN